MFNLAVLAQYQLILTFCYQNMLEEIIQIGILLAVIMYAVLHLLKRKNKKRIGGIRKKIEKHIQQDKIIIALELQNIFVDISDRRKPGFVLIESPFPGSSYIFIKKINELWGNSLFFKVRQNKKVMKDCVKLLLLMEKVQLFLYTGLKKEAADFILKKLDLLEQFPQELRKYSNENSKKHAFEVNSITKRVVIVTGAREDHETEDSKYFLVMKKKQFKQTFKLLKNLIEENEQIDDLHNELGEMKVYIESDNDGNAY